jgi:putative transposase
MESSPDPHYDHRFPAERISHAGWLSHVFSVSLRNVRFRANERIG